MWVGGVCDLEFMYFLAHYQHTLEKQVEEMEGPLRYFNEIQQIAPLLGVHVTEEGEDDDTNTASSGYL